MRAGGGLSAYQARAGANHRDEATILRDTEHAARHDAASAPFAPVDTWPEFWGDRPRGWSVYDEVPDEVDA